METYLHCSTLVTWTLNILFLKMLKFLVKKIKNQNFAMEINESFNILL